MTHPVDADQLYFVLRTPDDVDTQYVEGVDVEIVKVDTGSYYVYWDCAMGGLHKYEWLAAGGVAVAKGGKFRVSVGLFAEVP